MQYCAGEIVQTVHDDNLHSPLHFHASFSNYGVFDNHRVVLEK